MIIPVMSVLSDPNQLIDDEMVLQVLRTTKIRPLHSLPFLQPGRLIQVIDGADDWGCVNFAIKFFCRRGRNS
eukprot:SAG31_NODE_1706_length_7491_cov_1.948593_4_plen_72_part_00